MNPSIAQLMNVQEVDSEMFLLRESLRQRPRELDDDRKKVQATKKGLESVQAAIKQLKMDSDKREVDVKKCDAEIDKYQVALNQAKSNQEYTIIKEQIKRQEEIRDKAEEDVLAKLTQIDALEMERKALSQKLESEEKTLARKTAEVQEVVKSIEAQLSVLEARRAELVPGIDREHLKIYDRVLARHNNTALARVSDQVCQGCYMSVNAQEVNLLMQGQFVQCRNCSRLLYLT